MFAGGVDTSATETKGTVLIHSAEQVYQNDCKFDYYYFILFYWIVIFIQCLSVF